MVFIVRWSHNTENIVRRDLFRNKTLFFVWTGTNKQIDIYATQSELLEWEYQIGVCYLATNRPNKVPKIYAYIVLQLSGGACACLQI